MSPAAAAGGAGFPYAALGDVLAQAPHAALVCVAGAQGSTPRGTGTAMIVTPTGAIGTIGGGKLEYEALSIARAMLSADAADGATASLVRFPLAASVGQCCGGVATLAFATYGIADRGWLAAVGEMLQAGAGVAVIGDLAPSQARRMSVSAAGVQGSLGDALVDAEAIALARAALDEDGAAPRAAVVQAGGRPVLLHLPGAAAFDVFIVGNGHVGRALAQVFGALPARVRWVDARDADFPPSSAANIQIIATDAPDAELRSAPPRSYVVVTTHSHALDFELVAAALQRDDWSYLGMIGSRAKKAQLLRRLAQKGLPPEAVDRVVCPIGGTNGLPRGKDPGTIAIAVAAEILALRERLRDSIAAGARPPAA